MKYFSVYKLTKVFNLFYKQCLARKIFIIALFLAGILAFFSAHRTFAQESNNLSQTCKQAQADLIDTRRRFNEKRRLYSGTRNLDDFDCALTHAQKSIALYKEAGNDLGICDINCLQAKLNRLSFLLEVNEWMQSSIEELQKENWVSSQEVEQKHVRLKYSDWHRQVLTELNNLTKVEQNIQYLSTRIDNSKIVYAQINYALSLFRIRKSQLFLINEEQISWKSIDSFFHEAISKAKKIRDQQAEAYALIYHSQLYEELYEIEKQKTLDIKEEFACRNKFLTCAQELIDSALKIIPDNRKIMSDKKDGLSALEIPNPVTDNQWLWQTVGYQAQWHSGRIQEARGNLLAATNAYSVAVKIIDAMRKDLRSTETETQFSFRDQVQSVYREYVSLLLKEGNDNKENLKKARQVIELLQLSELENFLNCELPITQSADDLANEDLKRVENPKLAAVIIYPIILPDRLEVIFSLPNSESKERRLQHYSADICNEKEVQQKKCEEKIEFTLKELRYRLEQPYVSEKAKQLSKEVYSWLLGTAERERWLQIDQTLLFILDGALRNIPMAALESESGHYLIEKYAVSIAPRLQLVVADRRSQKHPRAVLAALTEQPKDKRFGKLKYAGAEVYAVKKIIKDSEILIGDSFTRIKLEDEIKKGVNIVHLATHGEFNFNREETFILVEDSSKKINLIDLEKLFQTSKNSIELLVLSACETATGDDRDTLGIAGMTVRTKARSAIASLWSINDPSAARFMKEFYDQWINHEHVTKAQALRQAILSLQNNQRFPYPPAQWAPYVLLGDWR